MALEMIYPSSRVTILDREAITELEKMLDTKFKNLDKFFELRDWQRDLGTLLEDHSDIIIKESYDWTASDRPMDIFPSLDMSISYKWNGSGNHDYIIDFGADGKRHEVYVDFEYLQITFDAINEKMESYKFIELSQNESPGLGNDGWFLAPHGLNVNELCGAVGYLVKNKFE